MKKKAGIFILTAALVLGVASIGFAATLPARTAPADTAGERDPGDRLERPALADCLTPKQRERMRKTCDQCPAEIEAQCRGFQFRAADDLPEERAADLQAEMRKRIQKRMAELDEQRPGCLNGERFPFEQ